MGISWVWCGVLLFLVLFLIPFPNLVTTLPQDYLKASPFPSWINCLSVPDFVKFRDGSTVRIILTSGSFGLVFAYGFFCNQTCKYYLFAIFVLYIDKVEVGNVCEDVGPQVVWTANQKNPISIYEARDADGTIAWSTNSSRKSVAGINMTDTGNLTLLDENDEASWQSFDHPTDSQYVRLGADGHLRGYAWKEQSSEWKEVDSLKEYIDYCDYPVACGNYGICRNAQCSCRVPKSINETNYFKRTNDSLPDRVGAP
ncbi:uncharacterized protein LOC142639962 [Castanea sativa]|uniref:uncharacterized protein LOC142639962 n=1 Tax=Castanea sativa TaxID=21020 RepID=UPI003F651DAB